MMKLFLTLGTLALIASVASGQSGGDPIALARQLVVVTTPDWDSVDGYLQLYERRSNQWRPAGEKIRIVVGRAGMAWGRGLHGDAPAEGPVKKEGDGKSPAGIFSFSRAFGYAAKSEMAGIRLPYVQATGSLECVDDVKSRYYNRVLDRRRVKSPDWQSSEQMRRRDEQYRLGVIVDHNADGKAGCGSCIFLHIWSGQGKGTAGCTGMEPASMRQVAFWLDPAKKPVLVQLPAPEYEKLKSAWKLP